LTARRALRDLIGAGTFVRLIGAHDGLTALLIERAGFEAIWAGGFGISTAHGVPDAGLLTMTELLDDARQMRRVTDLPLIADVDCGFGDTNTVRRLVRLYEDAGVDAICMEDKQYPKRNSFRDGHVLEVPEVFARKVAVATAARRSDGFLFIARVESLIAGAGMADALHRARLYRAAGADGIVIHSRSRTVEEVAQFCLLFRAELADVPVFAIPTTYFGVTTDELRGLGFAGAIYANQVLRATARSVQVLLAQLNQCGSTAAAEGGIASLGELFDLVGTHLLDDDQPWSGISQLGHSGVEERDGGNHAR
jgi:phosphoenolpyruvate phosphomutase